MRLAIALATLMLVAVPTSSSASTITHPANAPVLRQIHRWVKVTHHYQDLAEVHRTPYHWAAERTHSLAFREWIRDQWHARASLARVEARIPAAIKRDLLCIHGHEGSWTAFNPAGYFGGFQADWNFMKTYGKRFLRLHHGSDARSWSPAEQLHMAWKGYKARGFDPWPSTSAMCGL